MQMIWPSSWKGACLEDFNTILRTAVLARWQGSCLQLHAELLGGCQTSLQRLLQAPLPASVQGYRAPQAAGEDASTSSSDDDDDDDDDVSGSDAHAQPGSEGVQDMETDEAPQLRSWAEARAPIMDEDGFQLVQGRRRGR
eukprot:jgi/Botrbrau1/14079/Bobra.182_3s0026.1